MNKRKKGQYLPLKVVGRQDLTGGTLGKKNGEHHGFHLVGAYFFVFFAALFIFSLRAELLRYVSANQVTGVRQDGGAVRNDEAVRNGGAVRDNGTEETGTLFMTISDTNGVKRLLSSEHPAVLTHGLYFTFPDGMCECEVRKNNGAWVRTTERVYFEPKQAADVAVCVQFRARGHDGEFYYSRDFVMMSGGE
ncbi:MAG: hypothetical protein NC254_14545 [bacterium]|nr:hypothetical protein [bacterium]